MDANADDLTPLGDEFDDPTTLASWSEVNAVEGWGPAGAQFESWSIDANGSGQMSLQPRTVVWYEDWRGPLVFKEVTGDFVISTRMRIEDRDEIGGSDADDVPGDAFFSLGGLMIRTPRSITQGAVDWQPGSHSDIGQVGENYVFLSMGYTTGANQFSFEVKTTRNSTSQLELTPLAQSPNEVELQIARVGEAVIVLQRLAGQSDWTVHRRYSRPDLPETLQVGMVAYTDWEKANDLPPIVHNGSSMAPGLIVDPTPGQPFNPDLTANFDYARFARPQVPAMLAGADLVEDATDEQLLSFLGDEPAAERSYVQVTLSAVDADGNPLTTVEVGQSFFLSATVDDLRAEGQGVFSAYVDVEYPGDLANTTGSIEFADEYPNQHAGDVALPGIIDEAGAVGSLTTLGDGPRTLFRVPMVATATGTIDWSGSAGDLLPDHEFSLYGLDDPVDASRIRFVSVPVTVEQRWHNALLPTDVSADGATSPIDALRVINFLNLYGAGALDDMPVDASRPRSLVDVNNDQHITPLDALLVINALNEGVGGEGEGTAATSIDSSNQDESFDWSQFSSAWEELWEAKPTWRKSPNKGPESTRTS